MTPTDTWLATIPEMPALEGPAGTAERLLLLIHYGIDWADGWVASNRHRYWDHVLPERARAATFNAPTLRRWWCHLTAALESSPRTPAERAETEQLLREPARPVLEVVRHETQALLLRTRLTTTAVREQPSDSDKEPPR